MMTPTEYLVFVLYYTEQKSLREIGSVLGLPEENVRRIHDRVVALAATMQNDGSGQAAPMPGAAEDSGTHWHAAA